MPQLNKADTALHIQGSTVEFWKLMNEFECYDAIAAAYDQVQDDVEFNGYTTGTLDNGDPVNTGDYPARQRPGTRPSFVD